jgi:putative transposase
METNALAERRQFVRSYQSGAWSMTELCDRYGITRPTGYKWLARFAAEGERGLVERARTPTHCPHRMASGVEALLLAARRQYGWGATKLIEVLRTRHPDQVWPVRSTVNALLERHGLLQKQRRRRRPTHPGASALHTTAPNQVWPADFKKASSRHVTACTATR